MQDPKNNQVPSSEQHPLPTTLYPNYFNSAANNFNADSNRGHYGVMTPYSMYPMNQWPPAEGLNATSSMIRNQTTTTSDMTSITNNIPIMSLNQTAPVPSNLDTTSNSSSVANNMAAAAYMSSLALTTFPWLEMENNQIKLSKSKLYPPNPIPDRNHSVKPCGCDSVVVEGIPLEATVDIVKEVFERCGEVTDFKRVGNSYAIKFNFVSSADTALHLHGWKIEFEIDDDPPYTGTLHIEYQEKDIGKKPIKPALVSYTEKEVEHLFENLDDENKFDDAVLLLISWLDRGECSKRNASNFYSALQKTNNCVQKLMNEKAKFEENLNKAKLQLNDKILSVTVQLKEFEKVLETSQLQKVWDHLTKPQRKCIDTWGKEISKLKEMFSNELMDERIEDEMEMSDDEGGNKHGSEDEDTNFLNSLNNQADDLQNQLSAAEQETKEVKKDKEDSVKCFRQNFQGALDAIAENEKELSKFKQLLGCLSENNESTLESGSQSKARHMTTEVVSGINDNFEITENDTRLIGLIATFLNAHPIGASLDYISSYLCTIDSNTNTRDIENLMKQLPYVFKEESVGIGSSLRKKWKYLAFDI